MRSRTRVGLLSAAGAAATALAVAVAPLAAVADEAVAAANDSSIKAAKKAKVSAKGAAVRVPITYTCTKGWDGYVSLTVVERVDDGFAVGSAGRNVSCSGAPRTVTVYLQASAYEGAKAFEKGAASLTGSLDSYNPNYNPCDEHPAACGFEGAKPPTGASIFTAASAPSGAQAEKYSERSETAGTITLVN